MGNPNMDHYERLCTLSGLTEEVRRKKDPLKDLHDMSFTPRNRIVKIILSIAAIAYSTSVLMAIFRVLFTFNYGELLKYGAFLGVQIFLLANLWILLVLYDEIEVYTMELRPITFAFELSDSKFFSKESNMVKILKFVTFLNYVLGVLTNIGLILSQDVLRESIFMRAWTCQQFSATTCTITGYILSLLEIPVICSTITIPFIMVYYEIVDIVHVNYLNELIKSICSSHLPEIELYESEIFQRKVSEKLKMCIMLHTVLIDMSIKGSEMIYSPVILMSIGSVLLGTSMLIFILSFDFYHFSPFLIFIVSGTVNYLICVWLYIDFSQRLKNESENTYYLLTQLPWYYMNKENRKIFSTFLRKSEKPISCQIDLLEVNYLLLLRIFKGLYSVACIIVRFKPRLG